MFLKFLTTLFYFRNFVLYMQFLAILFYATVRLHVGTKRRLIRIFGIEQFHTEIIWNLRGSASKQHYLICSNCFKLSNVISIPLCVTNVSTNIKFAKTYKMGKPINIAVCFNLEYF